MTLENIPMGERILSGEKCEHCETELDIIFMAGDTEDPMDESINIGCPNGEGEDEHTEYGSVTKSQLIEWGWTFE